MKKLFLSFLALVMFATLSIPGGNILPAKAQQTSDTGVKVKNMLARLTPEEKVGQLFIATFKGTDVTSSDSKIADMVTNHYLGG